MVRIVGKSRMAGKCWQMRGQSRLRVRVHGGHTDSNSHGIGQMNNAHRLVSGRFQARTRTYVRARSVAPRWRACFMASTVTGVTDKSEHPNDRRCGKCRLRHRLVSRRSHSDTRLRVGDFKRGHAPMRVGGRACGRARRVK